MATEKKETKKRAPAKTAAKTATPRAKKAKAEEAVETTVAVAAPETKAEVQATESQTVEIGSTPILTVGRRKTAIARVRVTRGKGTITVNTKPMDQYFTTFEQRLAVRNPMKTVGLENALDVSVKVEGGGIHAQSEAVRLGISRALLEINPVYRKTLKKLGFLTRDPRAKERKKFGLKRARRAPQWSKR